jgi:hypothetical protein
MAASRLQSEDKTMTAIKRICTRVYNDTGQCMAYVEWADGSRTEGHAFDYHGVLIPQGTHIRALFDRAMREGLTVEREYW